ncbi:LysR family transcriptional regulator [Rhodalgimonas zhirmunskyi]|uniref:LysR family transcriptional regulator n=1 Tax=Rhodalgimonas zhirmunskyi TaxID=2964767 RepID=A0AAJ1X5W3_9RHOB|nr:LysR family transcriptional regulator [Rhodoalgimonas zhirmunskyi]MDQ2094564.1 LysR family transcriptional regulator [Rhodoalgimonas zhirmunskyi]
MDISLIKTFLDVASTGSFVAASERLFVSQSAVSLRIQRLEEELGQPLFTRSRAGAELTTAGMEFQHYAISLLTLWEEARQQVAIPDGFKRALTIGAQYSLWPRLGFRWIDQIQKLAPNLSIRAEMGMPDRLTQMLGRGAIQCALTYTPYLRPGLEASQVMQEELVLVASWENPTLAMEGRYIFVDWGPEFVRAHALGLPELHNTGLTMALGALSAEYIVNRRAAAYLPVRHVQPHLDAGRLHLVSNAPRFPYPIWQIWRDDVDPIVRAAAEQAIEEVVALIEDVQTETLDKLAELSGEDEIAVLKPEISDI